MNYNQKLALEYDAICSRSAKFAADLVQRQIPLHELREKLLRQVSKTEQEKAERKRIYYQAHKAKIISVNNHDV